MKRIASLFLLCAAVLHGARIPDDPVPMQTLPERPCLLVELGEPFLGVGPIPHGFTIPGGAVVQPQLTIFGTLRTGLQESHSAVGDDTTFDWSQRLDIFGNLQLSGTERVVVGFQPLHRRGKFTGYCSDEEWEEELNGRLRLGFFEGEIAEIFPGIDPEDRYPLDIGFSVGRQPILFQDGILINAIVDSVGVVKTNLIQSGANDLRITFLYGWDDPLYGLFTQTDLTCTTLNLDLVYVDEENSSWHWGASGVQRVGHCNTTLRVLGSHGDGKKGHLLLGELSWTPPNGHDFIYLTGYWGIERFRSAARDPDAGGPLGRVGLLYAAVGLGKYPAPLSAMPDNSAGGAAGYQMFFCHGRRQLVLEGGARTTTRGPSETQVALSALFQQAIGQRLIWVLSGFAAESFPAGFSGGARTELVLKF